VSIPVALLTSIVEYLAGCPWRDVDHLLHGIERETVAIADEGATGPEGSVEDRELSEIREGRSASGSGTSDG
jgi:hypothetical protein